MHAGRLHEFFWGAGRAGFPEILQIFRAIFAQNLRDLDTEIARYLANAHGPGRELLQRISDVRAATLAELTQLLCARRAENFRKLRNSFASWAQNLRDADAGRLL